MGGKKKAGWERSKKIEAVINSGSQQTSCERGKKWDLLRLLNNVEIWQGM